MLLIDYIFDQNPLSFLSIWFARIFTRALLIKSKHLYDLWFFCAPATPTLALAVGS